MHYHYRVSSCQSWHLLRCSSAKLTPASVVYVFVCVERAFLSARRTSDAVRTILYGDGDGDGDGCIRMRFIPQLGLLDG